MRLCRVAECNGVHLARGLCRKHYLRQYKHGRLHIVLRHDLPAIDRVKLKINLSPLGCWEYQGRLTPKGYAHVRDGKMRFAHVIMWEAVNGPKPDGLELDHLCRTRHCCNPEHLELVRHKENCARGLAGMDWATRKRNKAGQFVATEKGMV